jgi:hypothetical protein
MTMIRQSVVGTAVLLLLLTATPSHGQWVEAPGTGWVQLQVAHQRTQEGFSKDGTVVPLDELDPDAESITTTARLTGALGLFRGLDAWVDLPLHRQAFNGSGSDLLTTGLGDPRVFLRAGPSLLGIPELPVAVALRWGRKVDDGHLRERRRDDLPLAGAARLESSAGGGDEPPSGADIRIGVGGAPVARGERADRARPRKRMGVQHGRGRVPRPLRVEGGRRRAVRTALHRHPYGVRVCRPRTGAGDPDSGVERGAGAVQLGARLPVHGQSTRSDRLPASPTATLGYFLSWDDPLWK